MSAAPDLDPVATARAFLEGEGAVVRVEEALALLQRAAASGDDAAALTLARLLFEVGEDEAGIYWLSEAALGPSTVARRELARVVLAGRGLEEPDPVEAVRLLRQAGEAGDEEAVGELAELLCVLDPELLFEAAIWVADADDGFRWTLHASIADLAPDWFRDHGEVLAVALGL